MRQRHANMAADECAKSNDCVYLRVHALLKRNGAACGSRPVPGQQGNEGLLLSVSTGNKLPLQYGIIAPRLQQIDAMYGGAALPP
jgi:hypothetical protein